MRLSSPTDTDHHRPTIDQLAAELDQLARDIDQARRDLARCHHDGEPHFCDHATPRFRLALEAQLQRLNLLEYRWRERRNQSAADNRTADDGDATWRLEQLGHHLDRIRHNQERAAREAERHFCDQPG
jgi:hypothetical protein